MNANPQLTLPALAVSAFVALSCASADARSHRAHRQIPSWYFSLSASTSFVTDSKLAFNDASLGGVGAMDAQETHGFGGAIGYRPRYTNSLWDNTRFEIELGYMNSDIEDGTIAGAAAAFGDDASSMRYMANAYIDLDATTQFRPYIGGGAGMVRLIDGGDDDAAFAYQGMAGVNYIPASFPLVEFGVGYRYLASEAISLNASTGGAGELELDSHMLEATFRAYF